MASFATTRENCIRFRVQIQPKEIVINSQQLILTMDPFWTFIYLCECPTIGHVKKNILTKLNMLTKRLKLIQPDARSIAKPRPRSRSGSKNVPETDQDQDYSNINPEIDKHFKALKNSIIFRSCQLSMEDCFLPSIEKSDLIRDGDLVSINIKTIKCVSTLNEGRFPSLISQSISKNQEFNDTLGTGEKIVEGVVKKNKIKHSKGKKLDKKCIADSQLDEDFRPMKEQKCDFADDGRCSNSILYSNSNDKTMILSNTCLSNSSNVSREEEKNETEEKKNDFCCHTSEDKNTIISYDQNSSTKKGFHNGKVENNLDTRSLSALIQNLQKQHPDDVLSTSFSTSDVPLRNSISGRRKRIRKRKSKKINSKIDENLKEIRSNFTFNQSEKNKSLNQHIKFYEYEEDMMEIASEKSIHLNTEFLPTHLLLSRPVEDKRTNNYGTESSIKENSSKFTLESLHSNTETFKSDCIQGISIDPSKKFDELLKESQSSGKKMEIIKSQTGHSVYNYHRKKKVANYLIDPSLDVISNVSAVVQPKNWTRQVNTLNKESEIAPSTPLLLDTDTEFSTNSLFIKKNFEKDYEHLQRKPQPGDFIAFKVIELSENYNPTLSGFKEAKVLSVNADIDALQVELIGKVKKRQPGKFDLDDTCCSEEIDNIVTLNISELLEVMFLRTAIQ